MNFAFDLTITLGLIVTLVGAIVAWFRVRHASTDRRMEGLDARLNRHETRIQAAEQGLQSMPGREDLHGLSLAMSEMRGDMRELRAAMQGQSQILSRVETVVGRQEEHLLKGGSR